MSDTNHLECSECLFRRDIVAGKVWPQQHCDDGDWKRFVFCGDVRVYESEFDEGSCSSDICSRCGENAERLFDHAPKVWPAWEGK